ncbi:CAP domain-containing protein [Streptomyces sp. NPDC046197]|uniref:CAP domain-containing protein n=1 Tax=Streptomyces sp. NPDC046197 TaxID=3154337 RepID=UPI0033E3B418
MGKHRKKAHYRRTVVVAVAMGAVGVPSVAMACSEWPTDGTHQVTAVQKITAPSPWNDAAWNRRWNGDWDRHWNRHKAVRPASPVPTVSASTLQPAAPKPSTAAPSHTAKPAPPKPAVTAPQPRVTPAKPRTTVSSGAPKATASATPAAPSTPKATATASGTTARIVQLVNAERARVGCPALTLNAALTKSAQAHSEDMAAHQNMSHTGSDGSSPGDRITRAGYSWSTYGENVAYGYATPEQVMAAWMASPGHRANILNCSFKEIGVGLAQPNSFWTQDFGAR